MTTRFKTNRRYQCQRALQDWLCKRGLDIRIEQAAVPLDWSDPEAGAYPQTRLLIMFQGRCTFIEWERRQPHHNTRCHWNSEHLAYWFGTPSQVIHGHQNGCDFDLVTYTARPLWGLLGEHTYTD